MDIVKKHRLTDPLLILGVHRSGTSMLTRMVEKLGVFVGNDLQQDYESNTVIAINNAYFTGSQSSWDCPTYVRAAENGNNPIARLLTSNFDEIKSRFGPMNGLWGMKDPRFVVTLPLWQDVFPNLRAMVIRRDVRDIASSLYKRHCRLVEQGVFPATGDFVKGQIKFTQRCSTPDGALEFAEEQVETLRGYKSEGLLDGCLELEYKKLVSDPVEELSRIASWLAISVPQSALVAASGIPHQQAP